jgi:hypothetical protein
MFFMSRVMRGLYTRRSMLPTAYAAAAALGGLLRALASAVGGSPPTPP